MRPKANNAAVKIPPASAAFHVTKADGTYLKMAAKINAARREFAAAITRVTRTSGAPTASVNCPARAVITVVSTRETRSRNAAAKIKLKEKSLLLMNAQRPLCVGG